MAVDRRTLLGLLPVCAGVLAYGQAHAETVDENAILHDPEAPTDGNLQGDVTLVAFLDYNCPFCKRSAGDLARVVAEDGKIKLIYKDYPVIKELSVYAAKVALAAHFQQQYVTAHKALMSANELIVRANVLSAVEKAGLDMARLNADLTAHDGAIVSLLKRNLAQADSLNLPGTPSYLIGPFKAFTLDYRGFKQTIADARARQTAP